MPMIDVKILEDRLTASSRRELVARLTDALVEIYGEEIRAQTWITLTPYPRDAWAIGGTTVEALTAVPD